MSGVDHDALRATLAAAVEALGGSERTGPDRDGRGGRRVDGRAPAPAGPGRHRHRQVARLPGPRAAPQQAGRRRHRDPRAAAPAGRARPAAADQGGRRADGRRHDVRRAQGALQLRLPAPDPRGRARRAGRADRGGGRARGRSARRSSSCGSGPRASRRTAAPARRTPPRATPTASGGRSASPRGSAWARPKCPFGEECFAERAREKAQRSHLIITNHSLLAIDAIEGVPMIPEYDVVVIDEAHELTARVTQAATDELWASEVERAARRSARHTKSDTRRPGRRPRGRRRRAARRDRRGVAGPVRRRTRRPRRRARAGARRGPRAGQRVPQGRRRRRGRCRVSPRPRATCRSSSRPPTGWPPTPTPTCCG